MFCKDFFIAGRFPFRTWNHYSRKVKSCGTFFCIIPVIEGGGGGMDANRMNAYGIRCVGVATGYRKNHSTREELFTDDLIRAGELAERLILAFAKL